MYSHSNMFLNFIFALSIISCSSNTITNDSNRSPSSIISDGQKCDSTNGVEFSIADQKICNAALNFFQIYSRKQVSMKMEKKFNESLKRDVLTFYLQFNKSETENIMGRGGLRLRYLKYLVNEMSLAEYEKSSPPSDDNTIYQDKFPLIEIRPAYKDG